MKTASAQSGANRDTAITEAILNQYNTVGPDGTTTFDQTGSTTLTDSLTGKEYTVPQFTQTKTLTPEGQAIFDTNVQTQGNLANIGLQQSGRIGDLLGTNLKLGNEETEARLWELGKGRLEPEWARDDEAIRTRLKNSGIREGSAAWNAEMSRMTNAKTDARNQLLLSGRSLANQELLTERNQPINEISALLSGSQVSQPQFMSNPQTGVAGVDYAGLVQDKYKSDLAQHQAAMGGMFGLAGTGLQAAMMFSDKNLKEDIERVGEADNGLPIYSYRYKAGGPKHIGVMAQDVQKKSPDAVKRVAGFLAVDYDKAMGAA